MQAVKDTYNDDTSNISGNAILLKIQTQLKNIKSFYHVSYIYAKIFCKVLWNHTIDTYIIKAIDIIFCSTDTYSLLNDFLYFSVKINA